MLEESRPFSPAAERNKEVIFDKLSSHLQGNERVLEIGSGTAQHAVYFAQQLPTLIWHTSNYPEFLTQTEAGLAGIKPDNVLPPIPLDVMVYDFSKDVYDVIYTANTAHIMSWQAVIGMLVGVSKALADNGLFCIYGPFNYAGQFTSDSNASFDQQLRASNPLQGIRAFEGVNEIAMQNSLELIVDYSMPANNHLLIFKKSSVK